MDYIKTAWPILVVLMSLAFAAGGLAQSIRGKRAEDAMRDKAAEDREKRIRALEGRPLPGAGALCANHQDRLTEFGVVVKDIRRSLVRIEKKLDIGGNGEEE